MDVFWYWISLQFKDLDSQDGIPGCENWNLVGHDMHLKTYSCVHEGVEIGAAAFQPRLDSLNL